MSLEAKAWDVVKGHPCPRVWLRLEDKNLLLKTDHIDKVTASPDFLTLKFDCEYGQITIISTESLQQLFEELQLERIRLIDGRKLKIKTVFA